MDKIRLQDIKLQTLGIPKDWTVTWNQLYNIYPDANIKVKGLPNEDVWELFLQDLLQLKCVDQNLVLDLGWIPEADPEGNYELTLIANQNWNEPIFTYQSRNKDEIIKQINLLLSKITTGDIFVD